MHNRNDRLKEIREDKAKKVESEHKFKSFRLQATEEIKKKGRFGKIDDDQKTLCDILF